MENTEATHLHDQILPTMYEIYNLRHFETFLTTIMRNRRKVYKPWNMISFKFLVMWIVIFSAAVQMVTKKVMNTITIFFYFYCICDFYECVKSEINRSGSYATKVKWISENIRFVNQLTKVVSRLFCIFTCSYKQSQ